MENVAGLSKKAAATALHRDRSSVAAALKDVPGDIPAFRGQARWRLDTVRHAVEAHDVRVAAARAVNANAGGGDGDAADFRHHRARLMQARADAAELANQERAGKLCQLETVYSLRAGTFGTVRINLLGFPNKLAAARLSGKSVPETAAILKTEIYQLLDHLASEAWPCQPPPVTRFCAGWGAKIGDGSELPK